MRRAPAYTPVEPCPQCGKKHERANKPGGVPRPTCAKHRSSDPKVPCMRRRRRGFDCCGRHGAGYATREAAGDKQAVSTAALVHGRYARLKTMRLGVAIGEHVQDRDPLNLLEDLAAMRAIVTDLLERTGDNLDGVASRNAIEMLDRVARTVERVEKIRAGNAISRPDLLRLTAEMGRVVDAVVLDPASKRRIREAWLKIPLQVFAPS